MLPALRYRLLGYRRPYQPAAAETSALGELTAVRRMQAAEDAIQIAVEARVVRRADEGETSDRIKERVIEPPEPGEHQRIVATVSQTEMKDKRFKELLPLIAHVINKAISLVTPRLLRRSAMHFCSNSRKRRMSRHDTRRSGRQTTIFIRPTLISGKPGGGKTLLARRMGGEAPDTLLANGLRQSRFGICRYGPPLELRGALSSFSRNRSCQSRQSFGVTRRD
ncbi:hypothetical protein [Bradyrhizobium guangzhouense]|uniref:hypothetical protein n=1 Tax=Bradyrhizobium guangzhouense TaxID=1325095 RepID=UPI0019D6F467|nr:hypothetical protein [Bradyrhizobium guangzhouense]